MLQIVMAKLIFNFNLNFEDEIVLFLFSPEVFIYRHPYHS